MATIGGLGWTFGKNELRSAALTYIIKEVAGIDYSIHQDSAKPRWVWCSTDSNPALSRRLVCESPRIPSHYRNCVSVKFSSSWWSIALSSGATVCHDHRAFCKTGRFACSSKIHPPKCQGSRCSRGTVSFIMKCVFSTPVYVLTEGSCFTHRAGCFLCFQVKF